MSTEKKYFALRNINHDGRDFAPGAQIVLTARSAAPLLADECISEDEPVLDAPVEETPVVEEKKHQPIVGGERNSTGEPSIDGGRGGDAPSTETKKSFLDRLGFGKKEGVATETHIISEQDLNENPGLLEHGVKVGDEVELGPEISEEEAAKLLKENGTGEPEKDLSKDL